jgi:hypothetical protein
MVTTMVHELEVGALARDLPAIKIIRLLTT